MSIKLTYARLMNEQKKLKSLEADFTAQKKVVDALREEMTTEMQGAGTDSYKSNLGSISLLKSEVPIVKDWDALYKYIHSHHAYDILQRRITTAAWRDRREEEQKEIAGTEPFEKVTLRINLK